MIIYTDTRQKQNKHLLKHNQIKKLGFTLVPKKLDVGDYMFENGDVSVDTKQDLLEVCGNLFNDRKRFIRELERARNSKIKLVILIEEDGITKLSQVRYWSNKSDTGKNIVELLKNSKGV